MSSSLPILDDTIAAIATAPGAAGLAVVRVSGREALAIAARVFRGAALADVASHTLHHGWIVWPDRAPAGSARGEADGGTLAFASGSGSLHPLGPPPSMATALVGRTPVGLTPRAPGRRPEVAPLDEAVVAVFRAPRSYTREDVVEFSCHGGALPARRVLAALVAAGARLARPGEFTLRAFLNGRLDLAQAEAVADLIHAETERAADLALGQLGGALSERLRALTGRVADAAAEVEARVDFAEDVGGVEVPPHVVADIGEVRADLDALLAGAAFARAVREGVRVPIVGRPNVGKSSLFNALLGEERAIVTAVPGTTRDRVSEALEIAGVRVTLSDTAGLRETDDHVEAIGVARTRGLLADAPLVLWVVDGSAPAADDDRATAAALEGRPVIVVLNKCDLGEAPGAAAASELVTGPRATVRLSARTHDGLDALRGAIASMLGAGAAAGADGLGGAVANPRHAEALERARAGLDRAAAAARAGAPGEIVALELRESLAAIGEIAGHGIGDDLLDRIFSRFCIGK